MESSEKLNKIEIYLREYFDKWLIRDIEKITEKKINFTIPYILLVSAGIDFLGGLVEGFKNNSKIRSCNFIKNWMGRINQLYKEPQMAELIYQSARCGASHGAMYKKGIESSFGLYSPSLHLHVDSSNNQDHIFIHALQFTQDFMRSQKLFREEFLKDNIELAYDNLNKMLETPLIEHFENLVRTLKGKNYSFNSDAFTSRPPQNWETSVEPSKAPEEDDIAQN